MRKKCFLMWAVMLLLMVIAGPSYAMGHRPSVGMGLPVAALDSNQVVMPILVDVVLHSINTGVPALGNQESGIIGGGPVLGIGTKPESVSVLNQALSFDLVLALVANCDCHRSVAGHTDNIARKYLPDIV